MHNIYIYIYLTTIITHNMYIYICITPLELWLLHIPLITMVIPLFHIIIVVILLIVIIIYIINISIYISSSTSLGKLCCDLTVLPNPGIMVNKRNHPQMAELFRLVNYKKLPRQVNQLNLTPQAQHNTSPEVSFEEAKALICKSLSCAADLTKAPGPTRDDARPP